MYEIQKNLNRLYNGQSTFFLDPREQELLKTKDKIYYEVILNLRTSDGINLVDFKNKYNKELSDYYKYDDLVTEGLLVMDKDKLFIPSDLWYISNSVIVRLLEGEING